MTLKDRIDYERKRSRLMTTISEEAVQCGLNDAKILIDDGRSEIAEGNHKARISSAAQGTVEFDIAKTWFDRVDGRSEGNLRFAVRLAMRELQK